MIDDLTKDSYDFKIASSYQKDNIKATGFYSTEVEKFLPNFKWSKKASGNFYNLKKSIKK